METIISKSQLTYSAAEVAEQLGISVSKVYQLAKIKGFPTVKMGKRMRFSKKGLETWVEDQAQKGWYL